MFNDPRPAGESTPSVHVWHFRFYTGQFNIVMSSQLLHISTNSFVLVLRIKSNGLL